MIRDLKISVRAGGDEDVVLGNGGYVTAKPSRWRLGQPWCGSWEGVAI